MFMLSSGRVRTEVSAVFASGCYHHNIMNCFTSQQLAWACPNVCKLCFVYLVNQLQVFASSIYITYKNCAISNGDVIKILLITDALIVVVFVREVVFHNAFISGKKGAK